MYLSYSLFAFYLSNHLLTYLALAFKVLAIFSLHSLRLSIHSCITIGIIGYSHIIYFSIDAFRFLLISKRTSKTYSCSYYCSYKDSIRACDHTCRSSCGCSTKSSLSYICRAYVRLSLRKLNSCRVSRHSPIPAIYFIFLLSIFTH